MNQDSVNQDGVNEHEFGELAAGHALHALSPDDERAYLSALAAHPEWEHVAREDAATAAALADTTLLVTPPAALRADILARVAGSPQGTPDGSAASATYSPAPSPSASNEPPADTATIQAISRRTWTRGLFGLAASLVLLVAIGFGAVTIGQQLNQPPAVTALAEIQKAPDAASATVQLDTGGTATAYWSNSLGKAVLESDGLPPITSDQSYELWFIRDGDALSAGVVGAGPGSQVKALLDGQMQAGDAIAVTVEQAGGSPTGQPTTTPVVVIATNA